MKAYKFWIDLALGAITIGGLCCLVAAFARELRQALMTAFAVLYRPVAGIQAALMGALRSAVIWLRAQLEQEAEKPGDGPLYYLIGAVLYSALTAAFMLCDFAVMVLTTEAMGLEGANRWHLPVDSASLSAGALVTAAFFWGLVLFDLLGVTRLAPWRKAFGKAGRRVLIGTAVLFLVLSVAVCGVMAYWRGVMLTLSVPEAQAATTDSGQDGLQGLVVAGEDNLSVSPLLPGPDPADDADLSTDLPAQWAVYVGLVGMAVISISATAFSGVGLVILAKFVLLAAIGLLLIPLLPLAGIFWVLATILDCLFSLVERCLDLIVAIGEGIVRLFSRSDGTRASDRAEAAGERVQEAAPEDESGSQDAGFNPFGNRRTA